MSEAIIIAMITGGLTFLGTLITVAAGIRKSRKDAEVREAVMLEKIEELTREVRLHNNYVVRVPVLEEKVKQLEGRL